MSDVDDKWKAAQRSDYSQGKTWQREAEDTMAMLGNTLLLLLVVLFAAMVTVGVALYVWVF